MGPFTSAILRPGTLNIQNGGYVQSINSATYVGSGAGSGAINFSGGTLTVDKTLYEAGAALTGTGTIKTYGLVGDMNLTFDGTGIATVPFGTAGTATVNMTAAVGELGVGYGAATATLTIKNGATVYSTKGYVGADL